MTESNLFSFIIQLHKGKQELDNSNISSILSKDQYLHELSDFWPHFRLFPFNLTTLPILSKSFVYSSFNNNLVAIDICYIFCLICQASRMAEYDVSAMSAS